MKAKLHTRKKIVSSKMEKNSSEAIFDAGLSCRLPLGTPEKMDTNFLRPQLGIKGTGICPTTSRASPRQGTKVVRLAPRPLGTCSTGGAILLWPDGCEFHNSVPAPLNPHLCWVVYCYTINNQVLCCKCKNSMH